MDAAALISAALDWETVDEEEEEEFSFEIEENGLQVQSSETIFLKIEPGTIVSLWYCFNDSCDLCDEKTLDFK